MALEIIARRQFAPLYIFLDIAFLVLLGAILILKKKYMTFLVGIFFGIIYMLVDYGIFHLVCHARSITEGYSLFWVLFWMSMSYGFTNFVWIWLWLSKDKHLLEWSVFILLWWFVCPLITNTFTAQSSLITIQRTTGGYHGYMALLSFVGYGGGIIYNLFCDKKNRRIPLLWLLTIGILVQLGWESSLLLGGIRSAGFDSMADKLKPLIVNSLLETNLGMPYIYLIFIGITSVRREDLSKRENPVCFLRRIEENNEERVNRNE